MSYKAKVLYDFNAEDTEELSVREGDIITITETDVGDGWVMAQAEDGSQGLVPEVYTEPYTAEQSAAPTYSNIEDEEEEDEEDEDPGRMSVRGQTLERRQKSDTGTLERGDSGGQQQIVIDIDNVALAASWHPTDPATHYTCTVGPGRKLAKFGGMKTFVTYGLTPSFSNIQVNRRFAQFEWLHERLDKRYGLILIIPALPEKVLVGANDDDIIEKRRVGFQNFVDRICRHPILSTSSVWKLFITETDEKNWKVGKRMAEHGDDASRINVLKAIWSAPRTQEMENGLEREIWAFKYDLGKMEAGVKHLLTVANDQLNRYKNLRERENKTLGHSFCEMGFALKEDRPIFVKIGMNYEATSKLWNDHTVEEWKPVYDLLLAYRSLISGWLQLIEVYISTKDKFHNGKIPEMNERNLFVKYKLAINAEKAFFKKELFEEFRDMNKIFMEKEIKFYKQLTSKLESVHSNCFPN